jgi:hypothetical protein
MAETTGELRWEAVRMERERLDAFARVVALSLRCHTVGFLRAPTWCARSEGACADALHRTVGWVCAEGIGAVGRRGPA